jgi:CheY-like chemotaxis protein
LQDPFIRRPLRGILHYGLFEKSFNESKRLQSLFESAPHASSGRRRESSGARSLEPTIIALASEIARGRRRKCGAPKNLGVGFVAMGDYGPHRELRDRAQLQPRCELIAARREGCEPGRILVAEDDDDFREALKFILARGFPNAEIECVPDGLAALEAFEREAPSVTILDLQMPGMDGINLTKHMREHRPSAAMPIIVLTASGGPNEWRRLAGLGADRFLLKPVVASDVVALVRRTLGERSNGVPAPKALAHSVS